MTITITASGIALDGPLVAGEKVAVSVSGLSLAAEDKPTLALLARFPDALLASVELAEDTQTPGTWTGELDTATKQTALFFATARADERRDAALELVSGRVSLARLTVPMANSALCPKPDGSPFASPVYVPGPAATVLVGTTTTLPPGSPATVENVGTASNAVFNFGIPKGETGTSIPLPVSVANGGTGATSAVLARANLGVPVVVQPSIDAPEGAAAAARATADALNVLAEAIEGKYTKPSSGIPAGDLAAGVIPSVPSASVATPQMDGEASAGTSTEYARGDHRHPSDTSKLSKTGNEETSGYLLVRNILGVKESASAQSDYISLDAFSGYLMINTRRNGVEYSLEIPSKTGTAATLEDIPDIRYVFASPTPSVSGTAATVACEDRAINDFTVATGITILTITPPAAVTGRARDFFCRVTLTDSSLPNVTLSGATIDIGSTEVAGMTQGVNLLMFTEIASGHWLASRRSAS